MENRLEREIFQSQVPRTKRYPVYKPTNLIWAVNHKRHLDIEEEDKFRMVFVQVCIGYATTRWMVWVGHASESATQVGLLNRSMLYVAAFGFRAPFCKIL